MWPSEASDFGVGVGSSEHPCGVLAQFLTLAGLSRSTQPRSRTADRSVTVVLLNQENVASPFLVEVMRLQPEQVKVREVAATSSTGQVVPWLRRI
jgi:hypothetical protein